MKYRIYIYSVFLIIASVNLAYSQKEELKQQLIKLNQIVKIANEKHLNESESRTLIDAAIKGLIQKLDPHSYYFTPEEVNLIEKRRSGVFYGLGINYTIINDTVTILSVLKAGPAYKHGIRTGDKIISINEKQITYQKPEDVESLLNYEKEVLLNLGILKFNKSALNKLKVKTQKLPSFSVDASFMVEGTDIGYISINRFMNTTHSEITDSLLELSNKGMKRVIIDLRGNPGGILDEAYMTIDEFIPEGNVILMTRGRDPSYNETYNSSGGGKFEHLPLVLLVDKETASAPEIFAGAIQDLDRGLIIGETTFGKGLVQRPYQFYDGSELWLTVAQYYTPSGRSIQKPYNNNPNYGTLQDRIVMKDGLNLSHTVEVLPEYGNGEDHSFKTRTGRQVVGLGGVTPDYIINEDTLSNYSKLIIQQKLVQKYSVDFFRKNELSLNKLYSDDFRTFLNDFNIEDETYCEFVNMANANSISCSLKELSSDEAYLKLLIKSRIAFMIWDENKMKQVLVDGSKYIQKAIELMPVAEQILHKK